jgi:hypothetical protein
MAELPITVFDGQVINLHRAALLVEGEAERVWQAGEVLHRELNPGDWEREQVKRRDWAAYMRKRRQRHSEWLAEINGKKRVSKSPILPLPGIPVNQGVFDALRLALVGEGQVLRIKNQEWSAELEAKYALELRRLALEAGRLDFLAAFKGREERLANLLALLRGVTGGYLLFEQDEQTIWVIGV